MALADVNRKIFTKLGPLVSNRCYPVTAPQAMQPIDSSYIVFEHIDSRDEDAWCPAGVFRLYTVQVSSHAKDHAGCVALHDSVLVALRTMNEFLPDQYQDAGVQFFDEPRMFIGDLVVTLRN